MNGNPDLDRERLTSLFDDLSRELEFARTRVQIYVIGGAAMSMAFSRDRTTRDVDARIDAGHGALMKAVEKIARKRGLTRNWLNEEATSAIPRESDRNARTLYNSPYLTVTGASPKHLLAMKLEAGRARDMNDVKILMKRLGLSDAAEATGIHARLYAGKPMKARAVEGLERVSRELKTESRGRPSSRVDRARPSE